METEDDIKTARMVKENLTRYDAPSALHRQIRQDIKKHSASPEPGPGRLHAWIQSISAQWGTLSVGIASGVLVTSVFTHLYFSPSQNALEEELVTSHLRSLMANHLSDVASTDQHTVKPWFNGKLDYAPPVQDYSGLGFPLTGGRIDYIDHRAVAALVYRHKEHVINAFVWPASQPNSGLRSFTRQGFNMMEWNFEGMRYWLVSDINMEELEKFAQITRMPPTPQPARKN